MLQKCLRTLLALFLAALFFLFMLLATGNKREPHDTPASLSRTGAQASNDLQALTALYGLPLPYVSLTGSGEVADVTLGSLTGRMITWQEPATGLTIASVRPAEAAQALRREGQTMESTRWSISGKTFYIARGSDGVSAYYSDESAAYSFFLPGGERDALLTLLSTQTTYPEKE